MNVCANMYVYMHMVVYDELWRCSWLYIHSNSDLDKAPVEDEQMKDSSVTVTNWEFTHCPLVVQALITLLHYHQHHPRLHHQVLLFMLRLHLSSSTTDGLISGFLAPMCLKTDRRTSMARPPAVLFFSSMKVQMVWNFAEWISSKSSSMGNGCVCVCYTLLL